MESVGIIEADIFHDATDELAGMTTDDQNICSLWTYNYDGIQADVKTSEQSPDDALANEIVSSWNIAEYLPKAAQDYFVVIVSEYTFIPWKHAQEKAASRLVVDGGSVSSTPSITLVRTNIWVIMSDPRQPASACPYTPPVIAAQDIPPDYSSLMAIFCGIAGVMMRHKLGSWLALIFCVLSLANMKNAENDLKQVIMAGTFAVMGIVTNYMGQNLAKGAT